jgi:hypothetical protein
MGASFDFLSTKMTNKEILQKKICGQKYFFCLYLMPLNLKLDRSGWKRKEK